ncbi:MAG: flagellar hook-basal body complex protein FliE [Oscillospiraceae bacterium]
MSDINTSLIGGTGGLSSAIDRSSAKPDTGTETSFADVMSNSFSLFNKTGTESDKATLDLLTGNTDNLSSALITTEKAEIALNLTVAIRNKAVDAYKEIMNMQV